MILKENFRFTDLRPISRKSDLNHDIISTIYPTKNLSLQFPKKDQNEASEWVLVVGFANLVYFYIAFVATLNMILTSGKARM